MRRRGRTGEGPRPVRRWTDVAGAPVHSRETPAASRPGVVPWLLLHGLAVSSTYFGPLLRVLGDAGIAAAAPDLPGLGHTPHRAGEVVAGGTSDVAGMARFVHRWLGSRWPQHDVTPVPVLGNSLGAQVGVELALLEPGIVSRLVVVGPTSDPTLATAAAQLAALVLDAPRERPTLVAQVAGEVLRCGPRLLLARGRSGMAHPMARRLAEVDGPVAVMRGRNDPLVSAAWGQALASIDGGTLVELPGAHAVHHSSPDALLEAIRQAGPVPHRAT